MKTMTGIALAIALTVGGQVANAQTIAMLEPAGADLRPDLQPGEYVWMPEAARRGAVHIQVSLGDQRLHVYRGGVLIGASTISSGRPGYDTPSGEYVILQKNRKHYSNLYDSAPMPYMQRLTWDGVAMHAGQLPGFPASHGCIRLPKGFARALFSVTDFGTTVVVAPTSLTLDEYRADASDAPLTAPVDLPRGASTDDLNRAVLATTGGEPR